MSVKDPNHCEMISKCHQSNGKFDLPLARNQRSVKQDGHFPFLVWHSITLLPLGGHKIFVASLVDPFFDDPAAKQQPAATSWVFLLFRCQIPIFSHLLL